MAYQALYRKFRPPVFDDVRGQDHIVTTLRNQVTSGRVAHAYLFCGTRGTGKTSVAKIMARAVNCTNQKDGNPCGTCEICEATMRGANLNVVEIDAASNNGVDNIREIVEEVAYSPTMGRFKVYIIDEVHMLSTGAFNALLKTLEEPPSYVIFILATTEVHKLPVTILSRCQRYDFHRLDVDTIEARLKEVAEKEGIAIEDKALRYIARSADGAMRDGLSLLDRCLAFHNEGTLRYETVLDVLGTVDTTEHIRLFRALRASNTTAALQLLNEIVARGSELAQFTGDFVWFLRNLMLLHSSDAAPDAIDVYAESYEEMRSLCNETDLETILTYIRVFSELTTQIRYATTKRILLEAAVVKLCKPQALAAPDNALSARVAVLERESDALKRSVKTLEENGVPATAGTHANAAPKREEKRLETAVPKDIEAIVAEWGRFLTSLPQPARSLLIEARPSLSDAGELLIVTKEELNARRLDEEAQREELRTHLAKIAGKEVPFAVRFVPDGTRFEENFVDLQKIRFPITQE